MRRNYRVLVAVFALLAAGCHDDSEAKSPANCRDSAGDDIEMAGRTTGAAVKTGATTAWEGVKAGGETAAGWVKGGSGEAEQEWQEGKQQTRQTAREGAAEVHEETSVPVCPK